MKQGRKVIIRRKRVAEIEEREEREEIEEKEEEEEERRESWTHGAASGSCQHTAPIKNPTTYLYNSRAITCSPTRRPRQFV